MAPVSSTILLIFLPPGPIRSLIFSGLISTVTIRGAYGERSALGSAIALAITSRICKRASRDCLIVCSTRSQVRPLVLVSICTAVIPSAVPAILKSIPPGPSSTSCKSVSTFHFVTLPLFEPASEARPIAIPATGFLIGTPAAINDKVEPQVEAIELEPFDPITSDTTRIA